MKRLIFTLLFASNLLFSQDRYLIYFSDKGENLKGNLSKSSLAYSEAESGLTQKAIERRKKVMGDDYITYEDLPISKKYKNSLHELGIKIERELKWFNAVSAKLNEFEIQLVKKLNFVSKIERVKVFKSNKQFEEIDSPLLNKVNNSNFNLNYGFSETQLMLSDVPQIHDLGINGKNVLLGLLDTGFEWSSNPIFASVNVVDEYDFVFNDNFTGNESQDVSGQSSHGTYVFGIVGGFKDGQLIGAAYNADFLLAKTEYIPTETRVEEDNYAAALEWMEAQGVDISSSSLGYSEFDSPSETYTYSQMDGNTTICTKAAELAFQRGVLTISSAGNEGNSAWYYITAPADGINTLAIGAVTSDTVLASFSSHGPTYDGRIKPDVVTQGVSVAGANTSGTIGFANGTSSAAPIAAGVAALLKQAHPNLTNRQMRYILQMTSNQSNNPDNNMGYGLLSAEKAIAYPNYEAGIDSYIINKIFPDAPDLAYVDFHYYINNNEQIISLSKTDSLRFSFDIMSTDFNKDLFFYYNYQVGNETKRAPVNGYYYLDKLWYNISVVDSPVSIDDNKTVQNFVLEQNYPNPFNNRTIIEYKIAKAADVNISIYNILGEKIRTLVNEFKNVNFYQTSWDGLDGNGNIAPSGVYFYSIRVNDNYQIKKMVFLK